MIKTQKTRIAALLLVLITLFTALFIPINAAESDTSDDVGIEEITPRAVYGCMYSNLEDLFSNIGPRYNFDYVKGDNNYQLTNGYTYYYNKNCTYWSVSIYKDGEYVDYYNVRSLW